MHPRVRCPGSRLLCTERALRCARFQPSGAPQKPGTKSCACVLCLARPSGSGSQGLVGRTLPGCGAPSALRVPSPSSRPRRWGACALSLAATLLAPPGGCRPARIPGGLWLETGGLFCSAVGLRSLGPSLPLSTPPASCLRRGWAGPQPASSSLDLLGPFVLRTARSVFGLVNFLSLFCCPTV